MGQSESERASERERREKERERERERGEERGVSRDGVTCELGSLDDSPLRKDVRPTPCCYHLPAKRTHRERARQTERQIER
eukprot:3100931-Rhodomonas_salina.1